MSAAKKNCLRSIANSIGLVGIIGGIVSGITYATIWLILSKNVIQATVGGLLFSLTWFVVVWFINRKILRR
jgi:hypothetical protein